MTIICIFCLEDKALLLVTNICILFKGQEKAFTIFLQNSFLDQRIPLQLTNLFIFGTSRKNSSGQRIMEDCSQQPMIDIGELIFSSNEEGLLKNG